MIEAQRVRMIRKPNGPLQEGDFTIEGLTLEGPGTGEVLTRTRWLSLDPYLSPMMRTWQGPDPCWALGIIQGRMVAQVEASAHPSFAAGDWVAGSGHWQSHNLHNGHDLRKLELEDGIPPSAHLGLLGSSGITAWLGIHRILNLRDGETLTISSAAGIVGGIAGQLAKARGARVVGIAGGAEKCAEVVALGFDTCVDHRHPDFPELLARAVPGPVDAHFENVGAPSLDAVLPLLRDRGRIALCGLIAHYLDDQPVALTNFRKLLTSAIQLQGFRVFDYPQEVPRALADLRAGLHDGSISLRETVTHDLASAPAAYLAMLAGQGSGKHLIAL